MEMLKKPDPIAGEVRVFDQAEIAEQEKRIKGIKSKITSYEHSIAAAEKFESAGKGSTIVSDAEFLKYCKNLDKELNPEPLISESISARRPVTNAIEEASRSKNILQKCAHGPAQILGCGLAAGLTIFGIKGTIDYVKQRAGNDSASSLSLTTPNPISLDPRASLELNSKMQRRKFISNTETFEKIKEVLSKASIQSGGVDCKDALPELKGKYIKQAVF